jgi:hypothetical protein
MEIFVCRSFCCVSGRKRKKGQPENMKEGIKEETLMKHFSRYISYRLDYRFLYLLSSDTQSLELNFS